MIAELFFRNIAKTLSDIYRVVRTKQKRANYSLFFASMKGFLGINPSWMCASRLMIASYPYPTLYFGDRSKAGK
jgi:hypothetical protein